MSTNVDTDPLSILTKLIENNSIVGLFLIGLAAVVWFGGGNLLDKTNEKRTGKSSPWYAPWKNFNTREFIFFLFLFFTAMILGITGVTLA